MSTGRYFVKVAGRTFCVEPIADRNEKIDDRAFTNGGFDGQAVKNKSDILGGAIRADESIITTENGYVNIVTLPAGTSPNGYIDQLIKAGATECDPTDVTGSTGSADAVGTPIRL